MWIHELAFPWPPIQPQPQLLQPFTDAVSSAWRFFPCLFWLIPIHSLGLSFNITFLRKPALSILRHPVFTPLESYHPVFPLCVYFPLSHSVPEGSMVSCTLQYHWYLSTGEYLKGQIMYSHLTPILLHLFAPTTQFPALLECMPRHWQITPSWSLLLIFTATAITPKYQWP